MIEICKRFLPACEKCNLLEPDLTETEMYAGNEKITRLTVTCADIGRCIHLLETLRKEQRKDD